MIAIVQRTDGIKLNINNEEFSSVSGKSLLVLLGVSKTDTTSDADFIIKKLPNLRIFEDDERKMNLSSIDIGASIMLVSQFTLHARCKKGNRPNFMDAAGYDYGKELYEYVINGLRETNLEIKTGSYGEHMDISFNNNGPVTIILDSRE